MKPETFETRTKPFRGTAALRMIKQWIIDGEPIRPCYTSGRGKHTSNVDRSGEVERILKVLNLKFTTGNDAPRGGLTGNWIKVQGSKMKPVREAWEQKEAAEQAKVSEDLKAKNDAWAQGYKEALGDDIEIFRAWWRSKVFHPAPKEVMQAKQANNLTWKEVTALAKTEQK
jgi:hypothetical protein